jgi:hypothetical protein
MDRMDEGQTETGIGAQPASEQPVIEDVREWAGYRVDEMSGQSVARMQGAFVDAESGNPVWILAKLGRFGKTVPVSIRECAAAAGRIWVPHDREVIRSAPSVDPKLPLTAAQERQILDHYGIPEGIGRTGEIGSRKPDEVSARPDG